MTRWLLVLVLWPGIVFAQASPEALGEIKQELALIEAEIMALRALAADSDTSSTTSTVAGPIVLRLDRVEAELRFLTGRMEALGNRVEVMSKNLDLRLGDIAFRVDELEAGDGEMVGGEETGDREGTTETATEAAVEAPATAAPTSPPAWTPPPRPTRGTAESTPEATAPSQSEESPVAVVAPPTPKPEPTPAETTTESQAVAAPTQPAPERPAIATPSEIEIPRDGSLAVSETSDFEAAIASYQSGQPAASALALTEFLQTYPGSPYATEALYFLALAERDLGRHRAAARSFLDTFTSDPSGTRAPASLLGVGKALGELGQTTEACRTIAEVQRRFPNDPAAADATSAAAALSCG